MSSKLKWAAVIGVTATVAYNAGLWAQHNKQKHLIPKIGEALGRGFLDAATMAGISSDAQARLAFELKKISPADYVQNLK